MNHARITWADTKFAYSAIKAELCIYISMSSRKSTMFGIGTEKTCSSLDIMLWRMINPKLCLIRWTWNMISKSDKNNIFLWLIYSTTWLVALIIWIIQKKLIKMVIQLILINTNTKSSLTIANNIQVDIKVNSKNKYLKPTRESRLDVYY